MKRGIRIGLVLALMASATGASAAKTIKVTIKGMKFSPEAITAHLGDTIEWTNQDFVAHTATARDKAFDLTIAPNKSASLIVQTAADVEYFCRFHPMMKGTISAAN